MTSKDSNNSINDNNVDKTNNTNDDTTATSTITTIHNNPYLSRMTPSIITTINNTSPTPQNFDKINQSNNGQNNNSNNNNNTNSINNNPNNRKKRPLPEPYYESYIEDSFVGHWETEDDDLEDDQKYPEHGADGDSDSILHSSTIEFDFDSFGPESIIYAPSASVSGNTTAINRELDNIDGLDKKEVNEIKTPKNSKPHQPNVSIIKDSEEQRDDEEDIKSETSNKNLDDSSSQVDDSKSLAHSSNNDKIRHTTSSAIKPTLRLHLTNPIDCPLDEAQIDLKVIEPYKKVISHAGYCHHIDPNNLQPIDSSEPAPAVIVFSACYLPDRSRRDYGYVMDHLFLYVLTSLHELIADDYILIYLHNTQPSTATSTTNNKVSSTTTATSSSEINQSIKSNNLPSFTYIKKCYQLIGRRLRKNLKVLYLVKPTFWLKTIVIMCKPFISSKFSRKINFIEDMEGLKKCLPVDKLILPASADNI